MYFPSLLQFSGISGILFCVCLSSPPVHTGPAGGVTGFCRAAAPIPLCAAVETAPTAWHLGKPGHGQGATEAPRSCCVFPKMQMASMRQRRECRNSQLPCCAGTCQLNKQGMDGSWVSTGIEDQLAKARGETALFFHGLAREYNFTVTVLLYHRPQKGGLHIFMCAQQNTSHLL